MKMGCSFKYKEINNFIDKYQIPMPHAMGQDFVLDTLIKIIMAQQEQIQSIKSDIQADRP